MRGIPLPALVLSLAALAAAAPLRADDPGASLPLQYIEVVGQVLGTAGPIPGAVVSLEGVDGVTATADDAGSFSIAVPLAALGDPARRTVEARVSVAYPGWSFTLRNGQSSFALDLRLESRSEPARCRVRSNVLRPVDVVAAAIQRGRRTAVVTGIDFIGEEWSRAFSNRIALRSEAITIVGAPTEPRLPEWRAADAGGDAPPLSATLAEVEKRTPPLTLEPTTPARPRAKTAPSPRSTPRAGEGNLSTDASDPAGAATPGKRSRVRRVEPSASPASGDTTVAPGVVKLPGPGVTLTDASMIRRIEASGGPSSIAPSRRTAADVLAGEGECGCRIRGTIEIHPDHLLTRRLDLVVSLRDIPAVRDTIQLFMGSPRAFELPMLRCGAWDIEIDAVARREFTIVSADGRGPVDCAEGGLRQLRLVLSPR